MEKTGNIVFTILFASVILVSVLETVQCRRPFGYSFHADIMAIRRDFDNLKRQIEELKRANKAQDKAIKDLTDQSNQMKDEIKKLQQCCGTTTTPYYSTSTYPTTDAPLEYEGTTSTEFAIMFQAPPPYNPIYLQILIASDRPGSVRLEDKLAQTTFSSQIIKGLNILNVSSSHLGNGIEIANKGMLLKSDNPVAVYGMYRSQFSAEGFNAIPTASLGTNYMVMNYFNDSLRYSPKGYRIMVTAVNDSTVVTIKFNLTKGAIQLFGRAYASGEIFTTTISRLSTLHINYFEDLTGTVVSSDKPVAVTSGGRCDWVIQTPVNCQPNFEFLTPTNSWGTLFVVPEISQTPHYVLKILSLEDATVVRITTDGTTSSYTLMADKYFEIVTPNKATLVVSTKPIYVVLYTETTSSMGTIMVTVPANTQYANSYDVGFLDNEIASSFVCITLKKNQLDGLRMDGNEISASGSRSDIVYYGQSYTSLTIPASTSFSKISHVNPNVRFGVIIYGFYHFDGFKTRAFGYPAGLRLPSANYML